MKNVPTRITAACRMKFELQWADREEGRDLNLSKQKRSKQNSKKKQALEL